MITKKLQDAINGQIAAEMWSANLISPCHSTLKKKDSAVSLHG